MKTLSVVIPAYNEEDNIKTVLEDVHNSFPTAEIIVVNDASTDGTKWLLTELQKTYPKLKVYDNVVNAGHGFTVMKGLSMTTGDWILYIDADRQIDLENADQFLGDGFDFGSGYRKGRHDKPFRKIISFCLKTTNLLFHQIYIKDANCPFKLYRASALKPLLDEVPKSYIVPIACLEVMARKRKLNTKVIPVIHHEYWKERKGFLQTINMKSLLFFWDAFKEVVSL